MAFERNARRALALLFTLTAALPAHAFIYLKGSNYQKGERPVSAGPIWPARTLTFYVNTDVTAMGGSLSPTVTGADLLTAAQESVNAWMAACRADLRVEVKGTTSATYDVNDVRNVIQWDNRTTAEGNYYGTSTSTLAAATTVLHGTEFTDCDIVLNGNSTTTMKFTPATGEADLRSVLTHEIGHCLGLDHPIEPPDYTSTDPFITEATMVQTAATGLDPSDPGRRDIAQDDRDGVECLYERGKPFRTGLHCGSYSGTNGQGALTGTVVGGPTVVDTGCGGDAQGRNANPATDDGDGCVTSAIAGTTTNHSPPRSPWRSLGGSFGFLLAIGGLLAFRVLRRRSLRGIGVVLALALAAAALGPRSARAFDLELNAGSHWIRPSTWNAFAGMDPGATAWDRTPNSPSLGALTELRATGYSEFTTWGKWGGTLAITLPTALDSNAKATGASEQSKHTTLAGVRLGPDVRWFPVGADGSVRWFVGGRFGVGLLFGSQTFVSDSTSGSVSYRAWSTELALSTGAEIPLGPLGLVVEGGYSRYRSSYFASTGNTGTAYADFPSGTRLTTNTSAASAEDVRFDGSGFFATVGLQMTFGASTPTPREAAPKYDDYEPSARPTSTPTTEPTPNAPTPTALPEKAPDAAPSPIPTPTPAPTVVPTPTASPLADPLEEERKFQESLRPKPDTAPTPKPHAPNEIDPIPGMEDAKSPEAPANPERFDEPDAVPGERSLEPRGRIPR